MEMQRLERSLARVAKGEVSSLDALAAIAATLLDVARELDAIGRMVRDRQSAQSTQSAQRTAPMSPLIDDQPP